jgi:hypothetical protein
MTGKHKFESPVRQELDALTISGKTLGVRSFYTVNAYGGLHIILICVFAISN